jgi:hypothetical protein
MKITKERLIEIIKEELEAIQENEYGSSLVMGKWSQARNDKN